MRTDRCHHFEQYSAARPHFRDVIPSLTFCPNCFQRAFYYHSGLWLLLSNIILSQTFSKLWNNSIEDCEVENRSEKILCWHCEGCCQWQVFSLRPISSGTEWRHINMNWMPRQFQNGGLRSRSFKTNFFSIADSSEAKTSVRGKAECFLAIGEDKKVTLLERPSPLNLESCGLCTIQATNS